MEITGDSVKISSYIGKLRDKKMVEPASVKALSKKTGGDKVALSPMAREIAEAKKTIDSIPDIREEKVAAIKKQIETGTYKIDGEKVAFKMIKESILNEWL